MQPRIYLLFLLCLFTLATGHGQQMPCKDKLKVARRFYDNGQVEEVEILIKDCLKYLEDAKQKEAYRLLILAGLKLHDNTMARHYMREFLRLDKSYRPVRGGSENSEDPQFVDLYDKFNTYPRFWYGIKLGATLPFISQLKLFDAAFLQNIRTQVQTGASSSAWDIHKTKDSYIPKSSFLLGLMLEVPLKGALSIGTEVQYASYKFSNAKTYRVTLSESYLNELEQPPNSLVVDKTSYVEATSNYTETQALFELPAYLRYTFGHYTKPVRFYVSAGAKVSFLQQAKSVLIANRVVPVIYAPGNIVQFNNAESFASDITEAEVSPHRVRWRWNPVIGGGTTLKTKAGKLILNMRYNFAQSNFVRTEQRYEVQKNNSGYIDNDMKMSTWNISLGFVFAKRNVSLKKEYRHSHQKKKRRRKK